MPNALLVYPKNPRTMWSQDEALMIAGKSCAFPPAGLLTIAGMLPPDYDLRLIDMNVTPLTDEDISWADVVMPSGMVIHFNGIADIIIRANNAKKPVLAGGPVVTQYHDELPGHASFFLGEAEAGFTETLDEIVRAGFVEGRRVVDHRKEFRPMSGVPVQRFDLIPNLNAYSAMAVQWTRGCGETCTFCNIPALYGRTQRLKGEEQIIAELEALLNLGWRGSVMITDDNITDNQKGILPVFKAVSRWQRDHGMPFSFYSQGSLRMHGNDELMEAMYEAGVNQMFAGIESPADESLRFMAARKNMTGGISVLEKVQNMQAKYFKMMAGFILGFDTDPDDIATRMKDFIQESGIGAAMVGVLGILKDTPDYTRYSRQNRLLPGVRYSGDSGVIGRKLSFIPHNIQGQPIDPEIILNRHREVLEHAYSPENYFARTLTYLKRRERRPLTSTQADPRELMALARSVYYQGMRGGYQGEYWNFLSETFKHNPADLPDAVSYAIHGHHFITMTRQSLLVDDFHRCMERVAAKVSGLNEGIKDLGHEAREEIRRRYERIRADFRNMVDQRYRPVVDSMFSNLKTELA